MEYIEEDRLSNRNILGKIKMIMKSEYVAIVITKDTLGEKFIDIGGEVKRGQLLFGMVYLGIGVDFFSPCNGIVCEIFVSNNQIIQYGDKIVSIIQVWSILYWMLKISLDIVLSIQRYLYFSAKSICTSNRTTLLWRD